MNRATKPMAILTWYAAHGAFYQALTILQLLQNDSRSPTPTPRNPGSKPAPDDSTTSVPASPASAYGQPAGSAPVHASTNTNKRTRTDGSSVTGDESRTSGIPSRGTPTIEELQARCIELTNQIDAATRARVQMEAEYVASKVAREDAERQRVRWLLILRHL